MNYLDVPTEYADPTPDVCGFCDGSGVVLGADASEATCPACKGQGVTDAPARR